MTSFELLCQTSTTSCRQMLFGICNVSVGYLWKEVTEQWLLTVVSFNYCYFLKYEHRCIPQEVSKIEVKGTDIRWEQSTHARSSWGLPWATNGSSSQSFQWAWSSGQWKSILLLIPHGDRSDPSWPVQMLRGLGLWLPVYVSTMDERRHRLIHALTCMLLLPSPCQ